MLKFRFISIFLFIFWVSSVGAADLATIFLDFYDPSKPTITLAPSPPPFPPHNSHYYANQSVVDTFKNFNAALVAQLGTFPVTSSAGSFTFNFDPGTGVFERDTDTFGPTYAERSNTNGKGKLSVGFAVQMVSFNSLDGYGFDTGDINIYLDHDPDQPPFAQWYKGEPLLNKIYIDLDTTYSSIYANYGVTNSLDVGIAIPYISVDMKTRIDVTADRIVTGGLLLHSFIVNGQYRGNIELERNGSASGLGDIVLRAKYKMNKVQNINTAFALDVRLPTGDEKNLLGTGAALVKPFVVLSGPLGGVNYHANLGGTLPFGESDLIGKISKEVNYNVGLDVNLGSKMSVSTDLIGRYLLDSFRLVDKTSQYYFYAPYDDPDCGFDGSNCEIPTDLIKYATREKTDLKKSSSNQLLGTFGVKYNPFGNVVFAGNIFVPVNHNGLGHDLAFTISGDYTF